ncbi:C6 transcription factor [Aspergillus sclerotialis]|uniref:C6 transcription factor n=1 Tax=Aspergillus sclerotialis TaxID=2070753 RepID=A0A3A2ZXY4_9EURO|nr:C6 transcription factor [Aspergillus sclerotialis]
MRHSNGCVTCKLRKKKCDERKPICVACERNRLLCSWKVANGKSTTHVANTARKSSSPTAKAAEATCVHQINVPTSPNTSEDSASQQHESGLVLSPAVSMPSFCSMLPPESKLLLEHYVHKTGVLSTAHIRTFTPFVDTLVPIAASNNVLLQSMLALSGFHLSQHSTCSYDKTKYNHLAQSLQGLKYGLTKYATGDTALGLQLFLSIIILCINELVTAGQDRSIFRHLAALRSLARSVFQNTQTQAGCDAIGLAAECYAYLLVLSGTSGKETLDEKIITDSNFIFDFLDNSSYRTKGALFGCAQELYRLVPRATLASMRVRIADLDSSSNLQIQLSEIVTLYNVASRWEPESDDATFKTAGRIFQQALLTLLSAALHGLKEFDVDEVIENPGINVSPVKDLISQAITLLDEMPVRSAISTTLCWPLAVLGSYATIRSHRVTIQSFLVDMEMVFGFRNMGQTRSLLESIWSRNSPIPASILTLSEVMAEKDWKSIIG